MQTPLLDRAAHDNVLPILIDKMSNGIALESADWRRLIRLSEETKRRGAPVWGPWIDEVIDGVAAEWVAAGDRVRRNKARVTKEEADGATFPIYFFSQLAANQTELLRNSPRLSVMIGCFFDAFDEWGPNPRMQGLQAVAYSGLLTCLRKLNARTLCSACLEYLEVMPATRWREGPTVEQAHPLWACLKMLSLSLSRIHDSAARDPSRDPRELDGLLQQCRSWMVRGLYHGNSLVRMASTDVGIALWLFMGESLLNRGLAAPEGKTTAATESAKRNLIKCAVGLYETGKWRLGFASLGEGGNSAAFASSQ